MMQFKTASNLNGNIMNGEYLKEGFNAIYGDIPLIRPKRLRKTRHSCLDSWYQSTDSKRTTRAGCLTAKSALDSAVIAQENQTTNEIFFCLQTALNWTQVTFSCHDQNVCHCFWATNWVCSTRSGSNLRSKILEWNTDVTRVQTACQNQLRA